MPALATSRMSLQSEILLLHSQTKRKPWSHPSQHHLLLHVTGCQVHPRNLQRGKNLKHFNQSICLPSQAPGAHLSSGQPEESEKRLIFVPQQLYFRWDVTCKVKLTWHAKQTPCCRIASPQGPQKRWLRKSNIIAMALKDNNSTFQSTAKVLWSKETCSRWPSLCVIHVRGGLCCNHPCCTADPGYPDPCPSQETSQDNQICKSTRYLIFGE